jgi:branched-chain amino acid transport system permease protein
MLSKRTMPKNLGTIALLVLLLALLAFPAIGDKFYLQLSSKIMLMAIFAMSLDLLVGFTGLVSLGHAAFFGLGAYALWFMTPKYTAASLFLSLPVAIGVTAFAALLIGLLVLRSSGVYFIMVTLAFAQMFYYYAIGAKWLGGSDGAYIYVRPAADLFGWSSLDLGNYVQFYYVALALMACVYLLLRMILASPFGQVIRGIKSNETRAQALGFAVFRYKLASFVLAGALAGLAGYFSAAQFGVVNPDLFGWRSSGLVLMMVILGGIGTLHGPILGAFALVLLEDALSAATRHWLLPMGLVIILAVLLLPQGISGVLQQFSARRNHG